MRVFHIYIKIGPWFGAYLRDKSSINKRKVYLSQDLLGGFLEAMRKLRDNVHYLWMRSGLLRIYGMRSYTGRRLCMGLSVSRKKIIETFVEMLARTTYGNFIEYLGYPTTRLKHANTLLFDSYGGREAGELIRILKSNYAGDFDLIIRALGETIRGYPEYKWFDVFTNKMGVIIGENSAREVLNEALML